MEFSESSARSLIQQRLSPQQKILAVSKLQSVEKIRALYQEGQRNFAKNYIQEALGKIDQLADLEINWHLIGPVQKNKVKFLKKNFRYIHSVDSLALAEKISAKAIEENHVQSVFLQVNLSGEPSKAGFTRQDILAEWSQLAILPGLKIVGLMTMPPLENEPEKNRIYFKELNQLGNGLNLQQFSMGTSHDYQIALEEGATWIRLGTILFGERN